MEQDQTKSEPLKIAYLCDEDPANIYSYSGGNARIHAAMSQYVGEVEVLGRGWHWAEPIRRLIEILPEAIKIRAKWRMHLLLAPIIARGVRKQLTNTRYDAVFCPYSAQSLFHLKTPYPLLTIHSSDATRTVYKNSRVGAHFGSYWSFSRWFDPAIFRAEKRIFQATDLLFWPTAWLKDASDTLYDLDADTSILAPWGANVPDPGVNETPPQLVKNAPVHLLVLGRNWFAKGANICFETMRALRDQGVDARMTLVGCSPPDGIAHEHLTVHPNLDKSVPEQFETLTKILRSAHFMVMPSFESFGFAFCEASAYGMPSLCYRVGGVPVRDGVNGHALEVGSSPQDFAAMVKKYVDDPKAYDKLRQSSRKEYEDRLNWQAWGAHLRQMILKHRK